VSEAKTPNEAEADRVLGICNACRYCEGFCAVFPAMTRRLAFDKADVHYLANLCHDCGACLHACQYAPPHEFAVNVPRAMARVRGETYAAFAWPESLGGLYRRSGLVLSLALAAGFALFLAIALARTGSLWSAPGNGFYAVVPHGVMVALFLPAFLYAILALAVGVRRFWREERAGRVPGDAAREAARHALTLRYLGGGHGEGCNDEDDAFSLARRRFHHLTFYGFMLCFAATCVATVYHYAFGLPAPYGYASVPKILGVAGGFALVVGTIGQLVLNARRHPLHGDESWRAMDRGFIALLLLTGASGLVLMASRGTAALPLALCVHLGSVMALFLTLPYGKFAHAAYRVAALLKSSIERRQPSRLALPDE
jgi:citrate/tricarballylate utilization protein